MTRENEMIDIVQLFREAALEVDNRKLEDITSASVITQLGMDSVAQMELVSWFEEKLNVRIPDEELSKTLAALRPYASMVVIANADDYIEEMLYALRA